MEGCHKTKRKAPGEAETFENHPVTEIFPPMHGGTADAALAIKEKVLGSEHPSVATSLNNFALLYLHTQGRHAEADKWEARAKAIRVKHAQDN